MNANEPVKPCTAAIIAERIDVDQAEYIALHSSRAAAQARIAELEAGLREAMDSLNTVARLAGKDEYMQHMDQVRGYAFSRYGAAHKALTGEQGNG